jgi:hypothetical protein
MTAGPFDFPWPGAASATAFPAAHSARRKTQIPASYPPGTLRQPLGVADIPDGAAMMEEMAAQLRKYNCWACFAFQNDAQLEKEKVRKVVFGNIKQALPLPCLD